MLANFTRLIIVLLAMLTSQKLLAETSQAAILKIDVPYIELHSGPSVGYPVVRIIEKNEKVTVLIKRTAWLKVKDKRGIEGWLHEDELFGLSQHGTALAQKATSFERFKNRDIESGVMYGDLDGANFYNVYLGYNFTPVFSTEFSVGKALGNLSDSDLVEAMLISHPFPDFVITPYLGIGGGIIKTTPHSVLADSEKRESTLMSAATGIKYHVARNFILRAEYKYSLALTDRDENEEIKTWKIGFSVFF